MKIKKLPKNSQTKKCALPRFYRGGEKAVLVLHGFGGFTEEMDYLARRLHEKGFTVSVPRLPGHGTYGADFGLSGWKDWLRRYTDAYMDLKAEHETVYVTGLSMGAVLTLILASHFEIPRIALTAPAIVNREKAIYLTPLMKLFVDKMPRDYKETRENPEIQEMAGEYWSFNWMAQAASLLKLQKMARKGLSRVSADTLVFVSEADKRVPEEAAEMIERGISSAKKETIHLKDSPHVMVDGPEKEFIADRIVEWFS